MVTKDLYLLFPNKSRHEDGFTAVRNVAASIAMKADCNIYLFSRSRQKGRENFFFLVR